MDTENPLVSICCITYNQANYIEKTIESFLEQNTSFSFEVLVHDDASTDGTLEKLKAFEASDDRVRLFTEEKNRYNERIKYIDDILIPRARGKYIAVCEGDDYWNSTDKLQVSIDYLECHPESSLFANAAILEDGNGCLIGEMGLGDHEDNLTTGQLVNNWHIPSASFVFRKVDAEKYRKQWTFKTPVGDFPRAFFLSTVGLVHYCPDKLCVYRFGSVGSWTSRNMNSNATAIASAKDWLEMLENIDRVTCQKYHNAVLDSAAPKVMRLYGWLGIDALDVPLARQAWTAMSFKKKCISKLLRLLGKLGLDLNRIGWSGLKQWAIVRAAK